MSKLQNMSDPSVVPEEDVEQECLCISLLSVAQLWLEVSSREIVWLVRMHCNFFSWVPLSGNGRI